MPAPKIDPLYASMSTQVGRSLALLDEAHRFRRQVDDGWRTIPSAYVQVMAELSFLRIFLAWEDFLEETFVRYMCGAKSACGYSATQLAQWPSVERARRVVHGSRPYADWAHADVVIDRANLHFRDGEPYKSALRAGMVELQEMVVVRNRIAHRSSHATTQFRKLVRHKLGYNPQGMGPGRLLLTLVPPARIESFVSHYARVVLAVGNAIIAPAIT